MASKDAQPITHMTPRSASLEARMKTYHENVEFFRALVKWSEGDTSFFTTYWTWAEHIGDAIERIQGDASRPGIDDLIVAEIGPCDFGDLPDEVTSNDDNIFVSDTRHAFPTEHSFRLPYGVVLSVEQGPHDSDEFAIGHSIQEYDDGLIELAAVVEEPALLSLYIRLIDKLPDIDVFWVKLHDEWEEPAVEAIYTNKSLDDSRKIESFLIKNRLDTLSNGYVTITTYCGQGQTNLNISDHKMIVILGYDRSLIEVMGQTLEESGVPRRKQLAKVDCEFYHWHFRHPKSKRRRDLIAALEGKGFSEWNPDESNTPSTAS